MAVMELMLREIGQMKDLALSKGETPSTYYAKVPKRGGRGFTFFFTAGEYRRYLEHRANG